MKQNKLLKVFSLVVVVHMALVAMLVMQPGCNSVSGGSKTAMAAPMGNANDSGLWDVGGSAVNAPAKQRSRPSADSRIARNEDAPIAFHASRPGARDEIVDLSGTAEFETASVYSEHNQHYAYTVKAGDSVWKIANSHAVSMRKLMEMNGLKENSRIHPGQTLMIPGEPEASMALAQVQVPTVKEQSKPQPEKTLEPVSVVAETAIPEMRAPKASPEAPRQTVLAHATLSPMSAAIPMDDNDGIYEVEPGDSLYLIAMHNNTSVEAIRQLNGMEKNLIKPGQQLRIPGKYQGAPVAARQTPERESFTVAFNDVPVSGRTDNQLTHEVAPGEYPGLIARKYNMSLTDLLALNNIQNPRMLRVGTKLKVIDPEAMLQRAAVATTGDATEEASVASKADAPGSSESESTVSTINFDEFPVIRVGS